MTMGLSLSQLVIPAIKELGPTRLKRQTKSVVMATFSLDMEIFPLPAEIITETNNLNMTCQLFFGDSDITRFLSTSRNNILANSPDPPKNVTKVRTNHSISLKNHRGIYGNFSISKFAPYESNFSAGIALKTSSKQDMLKVEFLAEQRGRWFK
ncbi:MAG: hypothetical protein PHO83_00850 [Geobacteraceae bacterium]|nr:hypothetical protein [Geobacteraceae bacterium]